MGLRGEHEVFRFKDFKVFDGINENGRMFMRPFSCPYSDCDCYSSVSPIWSMSALVCGLWPRNST